MVNGLLCHHSAEIGRLSGGHENRENFTRWVVELVHDERAVAQLSDAHRVPTPLDALPGCTKKSVHDTPSCTGAAPVTDNYTIERRRDHATPLAMSPAGPSRAGALKLESPLLTPASTGR